MIVFTLSLNTAEAVAELVDALDSGSSGNT